jgi:tRNA(Leu) C34 or U34 (ribose-2'-O)-methylase TrmL
MSTVVTQTGTSTPDLDGSIQLSIANSQLHDSLEASLRHQSSDRSLPLEDADQTRSVNLSRSSAVILITTLTGINFVGSMSNGLLTVALPTIAKDLSLPSNLLLW